MEMLVTGYMDGYERKFTFFLTDLAQLYNYETILPGNYTLERTKQLKSGMYTGGLMLTK